MACLYPFFFRSSAIDGVRQLFVECDFSRFFKMILLTYIKGVVAKLDPFKNISKKSIRTIQMKSSALRSVYFVSVALMHEPLFWRAPPPESLSHWGRCRFIWHCSHTFGRLHVHRLNLNSRSNSLHERKLFKSDDIYCQMQSAALIHFNCNRCGFG